MPHGVPLAALHPFILAAASYLGTITPAGGSHDRRSNYKSARYSPF
jgi:hypothetical protein